MSYLKLIFTFLLISNCCEQSAAQNNYNISCNDKGCKGSYKCPEFINGEDVAHQLSNKISAAVGDQLKELYYNKKYSKVNLTQIIMTTDGMGTGQVVYNLNIPFERVKDKCDSYTSFDHVVGWNHKPALQQRISQLENLPLDGTILKISKIKITKEGLQEYWIQWKNKDTQADCRI